MDWWQRPSSLVYILFLTRISPFGLFRSLLSPSLSGEAHLFSRGEFALRDIWREPSGELEGERAIHVGTGIAAVCRAPNEIATAALKRMAGRTQDFPCTLSQVIAFTSFRADFFFYSTWQTHKNAHPSVELASSDNKEFHFWIFFFFFFALRIKMSFLAPGCSVLNCQHFGKFPCCFTQPNLGAYRFIVLLWQSHYIQCTFGGIFCTFFQNYILLCIEMICTLMWAKLPSFAIKIQQLILWWRDFLPLWL